ncbi:hypothetical protein J2S67_000077 [Pseudoglutamicibacter albus]|uniref:Uncharacterized protein n=1 Tax=Pseudoglutamicibacter albus TaxID=98671 RepID=A0ABU1YWR9_9MICC|nr:hypothetical protein [Pseudoglutamicibacter albus]
MKRCWCSNGLYWHPHELNIVLSWSRWIGSEVCFKSLNPIAALSSIELSLADE